jgi:hypothetical protein
MATHKKAGVKKWNRAENARFFDLSFPHCTIWREGNYFSSFITIPHASPLSAISFELTAIRSYLRH